MGFEGSITGIVASKRAVTISFSSMPLEHILVSSFELVCLTDIKKMQSILRGDELKIFFLPLPDELKFLHRFLILKK